MVEDWKRMILCQREVILVPKGRQNTSEENNKNRNGGGTALHSPPTTKVLLFGFPALCTGSFHRGRAMMLAVEDHKQSLSYSSIKLSAGEREEEPHLALSRFWAPFANAVLGMGSSEGGRSPAAVSMADGIRRWRLPEFAGLAVAFTAVALIEACFSEYDQFVPEVSWVQLVESAADLSVGVLLLCCTASVSVLGR